MAIKWKLALCLALLLGLMPNYAGRITAASAAAQPEYAKWGRMAMQETQKRYQADIVDYKHLGRRQEQPGVLSESFRLLLDRNGSRFGVTVSIWFERDTERVVQIRFTED